MINPYILKLTYTHVLNEIRNFLWAFAFLCSKKKKEIRKIYHNNYRCLYILIKLICTHKLNKKCEYIS